MKGSVEKMNRAALVACVVAFAAGTAGAHVLDEATYFWRFDRDVNGDGSLQATEIRDVRHWGSTNVNGYAGTLAPTTIHGNGLTNGPYWVTDTVPQPARGLSTRQTYLHFPVQNVLATNATSGVVTSNTWPTAVEFSSGSITGSVTVLIRLRADTFNAFLGNGDYSWVVNNGEQWANHAGSSFGFRPSGTVGRPSSPLCMMFGEKSFTSSMTASTNVWYDIGYSLKDTGDGGAEGLFMLRDVDPPAPSDLSSVVSYGFRFEKKTLAAGSGAFTNEARNAARIVFSGEQFGKGTGNQRKCFGGDIQQVVMWNRALTTNELIEASLQNMPLFRVGLEDGSAGEFGLADEAPADYAVEGAPWHDMMRAVSAAHPELRLAVSEPLKNINQLWWILRVKAAPGDAGRTSLRVTVNGTPVDTLSLAAGEEDTCYVGPKHLRATGNVIALTRLASSTAPSLAFDVIEMTGSWQLGTDNSSNSEFSREGAVKPTFYVGDWNFAGVQRGCPTGVREIHLHFWMPERIAARHAFTFSGRVVAEGAGAAEYSTLTNQLGYVKDQWPFSVYLNGEKKFSTGGMRMTSPYSFNVAPGEIKPGWNVITHRNDVTGATCWVCWDFHRLNLVPIPSGTIMIMR